MINDARALKRAATILLVGASVTAGSAIAQTSTSPATPTSAITTDSASSKFVTEQSTSEFRASKFVGLDVYGSDNQKVGDINEILIDGSGSAKVAVIGVGGFLGIGEKTVAVPFSSLEWVNTAPTVPAAATAANSAPPAGTVPSTLSTLGTASTNGPTATGSTTQVQRTPAETAAYNGYPDHAVLRMTKADLEGAPTFKYFGQTASNATVAPGTMTPAPTTRP